MPEKDSTTSVAKPETAQLQDDLMAFQRRLRAKRADHMLTPTQLQALGHLMREGPMSLTSLAHFEQVTPQSMARIVAVLLEQGLVRRDPDPNDARAGIISLTELGESTLSEDRLRRSSWLQEVLDQECTEHERELLYLAGKLIRRLGATTWREAR
ncbi:MarR family winged helix-turn-helix transcriptional regulator [Segniliparus rugosus]|uniref:HTH marR-type domain-containing protein n=1 Tax=Segniliparus rugosus (strain ATCC BAA-974 / DSM 45345 / CCUG 50838 / CIP 108380 / JCM 13579 / CDC 945) TaxID=679197 RepID=E5XV79_SEGRC|nr:MarR family transcriptional regulator [Segniliparus rugosus]EFV11784.1 hypothetical protein HMPREF9336_03401 [Segniliparus rugosus ATCC BAA-974]